MKISSITTDFFKEYARIDYDDIQIQLFLDSAKAYIKSYTGITDDLVLDSKEDLTTVYLALTSELYDNRTFTMDKNSVNKILDSILSMYCINLL